MTFQQSTLRTAISFILLTASSIVGFAQDDPGLEEHLIAYEQRIAKTHLNGHYIPKDVDEALTVLDQLVSPASQEKLLVIPEDQLVRRLFFGFGRWLAVNWGMYDGSRYSHHLKTLGISHPEDLVAFTMIVYQRKLRGEEIDAKSLAERLRKERDALRQSQHDTLPIKG